MFPKHLSCFRNMWFWHTGRSIVVCIYDNFGNNVEIENGFTNLLKERPEGYATVTVHFSTLRTVI